MKRVVIVGGNRIPFARSFSHYSNYTSADLMTFALKGLVDRFSLQDKILGEVVLGSVMKKTSDWNLARESALGCGLNPYTPAYDLARACGTGLEAAIAVRNKIALGQIEVGIAGGVDSNSDISLSFSKSFTHKLMNFQKAKSIPDKIKALMSISVTDLRPQMPVVVEPRTGKSMGQHCELMAQKWEISRELQDELAYESHQRAVSAWKEGFYDDLVTKAGKVDKDQNMRAETTKEKLATLKTVFDRGPKASLTAGNSTPLSDGASCVLLCSEDYAKEQNWPILAYFEDVQTSAVDFVKGDGLLMAPVNGIKEILNRNKLSFKDIDCFEIHEAFCAQVLCTLKALEPNFGQIDRSKLNIKGGSVAIGHPFAATGARVLVGAAKILHQQKTNKALVSICTGGGMGVVSILSRI